MLLYYRGNIKKNCQGVAIVGSRRCSEYPPGTRPRAEYFPMRNRLISSWSEKVLVVEASEKSGALITANYAKSQGKLVYVPPNEIFRSTGKGTNKLLMEGANIFLNSSQLLFDTLSLNDIEDEIPNPTILNDIQTNNVLPIEPPQLSPIEEKIISCISNTPKSIEAISIETQIAQTDLMVYLSEMELEGKIIAVVGGRYTYLF